MSNLPVNSATREELAAWNDVPARVKQMRLRDWFTSDKHVARIAEWDKKVEPKGGAQSYGRLRRLAEQVATLAAQMNATGEYYDAVSGAVWGDTECIIEWNGIAWEADRNDFYSAQTAYNEIHAKYEMFAEMLANEEALYRLTRKPEPVTIGEVFTSKILGI